MPTTTTPTVTTEGCGCYLPDPDFDCGCPNSISHTIDCSLTNCSRECLMPTTAWGTPRVFCRTCGEKSKLMPWQSETDPENRGQIRACGHGEVLPAA